VIHARASVPTASPQILLDRAGAVSGLITEAASHAPPQMSVASLNPMRLGVYGTGVFNYVGADGRYTLAGLGPYRWPLLFGSVSDAQQWSGGSGSRFAANTLQIVAGATAIYDVAMRPGVILSGSVRTATGAPVTGFTLVFHNALTGGIMSAASGPYGPFRARLY
jgi:hypothetical protein